MPWVCTCAEAILRPRLKRSKPSSGRRRGAGLVPIEIKSGQTLARDFFAGFRRFAALAGEVAAPGWLVYRGERTKRRTDSTALPWTESAQLGTMNR